MDLDSDGSFSFLPFVFSLLHRICVSFTCRDWLGSGDFLRLNDFILHAADNVAHESDGKCEDRTSDGVHNTLGKITESDSVEKDLYRAAKLSHELCELLLVEFEALELLWNLIAFSVLIVALKYELCETFDVSLASILIEVISVEVENGWEPTDIV